MSIRLLQEPLPEIVQGCLRKKPRKVTIVAKTQPVKAVLRDIKAQLDGAEVKHQTVNISGLTYMVLLPNGSAIEVLDKSKYEGADQVFHRVVYIEGDGYRFYKEI